MESTGLNQPDRFDSSIQRIESKGYAPHLLWQCLRRSSANRILRGRAMTIDLPGENS
jgi:hypothetical protein